MGSARPRPPTRRALVDDRESTRSAVSAGRDSTRSAVANHRGPNSVDSPHPHAYRSCSRVPQVLTRAAAIQTCRSYSDVPRLFRRAAVVQTCRACRGGTTEQLRHEWAAPGQRPSDSPRPRRRPRVHQIRRLRRPRLQRSAVSTGATPPDPPSPQAAGHFTRSGVSAGRDSSRSAGLQSPPPHPRRLATSVPQSPSRTTVAAVARLGNCGTDNPNVHQPTVQHARTRAAAIQTCRSCSDVPRLQGRHH